MHTDKETHSLSSSVQVTESIYDLMGNGMAPPGGFGALGCPPAGLPSASAASHSSNTRPGAMGKEERRAHVDRLFETMDLNHDGQISMEEFIQYCSSQQEIKESMTVRRFMYSVRRKCPPVRPRKDAAYKVAYMHSSLAGMHDAAGSTALELNWFHLLAAGINWSFTNVFLQSVLPPFW